MNIRDSIVAARRQGASDVHLETGAPPVMRVRGVLKPFGDAVPAGNLLRACQELLAEERWREFLQRGSADLSLMLGGTRCRINLYRTVRGLAVAARLLSPAVNDLRGSNLHPDLRRLVEANTGLVVVSGPTGSGKSTTLAALIEEVNLARARLVITLESPLEYIFTNRSSLIRQREIPTHAPSFEQGILDALRENPDMLVIGEMRSPEVMRLTLNAAETGHLVLTTMHSASCAEALSRIVMSFPAEIQGSVRAQLADCLVGVVCQRLEYLESAQLRIPRCEILTGSSAARGTIRAGAMSQLSNVIQAGGEDGMWSFDRYQRWIDERRDWVRPSSAVPVPDDLPTRSAAPPATRPPAPIVPPAASAPVPGEQGIEIDIEENADLAELARRVERKT